MMLPKCVSFMWLVVVCVACVGCVGCASEGELFLDKVRDRYKSLDTLNSVGMQIVTTDSKDAGTLTFTYTRVHFDRLSNRIRVASETSFDMLVSSGEMRMKAALVSEHYLRHNLPRPVTAKQLAAEFPWLVAADSDGSLWGLLFPVDARVVLGDRPLQHWDWEKITLCEPGFDDTGFRKSGTQGGNMSLFELHNSDIRMTTDPKPRDPRVIPRAIRLEAKDRIGFMTVDPDTLRIGGYVIQVPLPRQPGDQEQNHVLFISSIRDVDPAALNNPPFAFDPDEREPGRDLNKWLDLVIKAQGGG